MNYIGDCLVSTEDADNPDVKCESHKVSDVQNFLSKFLDKVSYPDGKLPSVPSEYGASQSNRKYRCHVLTDR